MTGAGDDSTETSPRMILEDLWDFGTVAAIIGFTYVVFIAPVQLLRGESTTWKEKAAGVLGTGVWIFYVWGAVEVLG